MNMVDLTAVQKIARAFGISIRDLIEVVKLVGNYEMQCVTLPRWQKINLGLLK